ncbi:hypothetical protein TRFO_02984 [Tritrichomonas foetus]|uniref:Guanylate cyclase domain-containing protein n=1 Tax=Tritrichomonas foetus TaxID=1144522 RepID=A0A1J4KTY8_9EUKA|nr:hypothetical protein TRFO_02984 [Tritrichomonas foetus]|eukprot:OHT14727.1 hypothetical protein TRFO_02984 [Tritrichomonas foetus]
METSNFSSATTSSYNTKREELPFLRKSIVSRFKTVMWHFFGYAFASFPIYPTFVKICSVLRQIQMIVPAMFLSIEDLYPPGTIMYRIAKVLSVFTRIIPIGSEVSDFCIIGWILFIFALADVSTTVLSTFHFSKKSELPRHFINYINFFGITINNILKPIALNVATILLLWEKSHTIDFILSGLIFLLFGGMFLIDLARNVASLTFFPTTFITMRQFPHTIMNLLTPFLCVLSELDKIIIFPYSKIIFPFIMIAIYIIQYYFMAYMGILIASWEYDSFGATTCTSILVCCSSLAFYMTNHSIPLFVPLFYFAIWIVFLFIISFIRRQLEKKSLKFLDELEKNGFEDKKLPSQCVLLHYITNGCLLGHPYCTSLAIFRDIIEICPEKHLILFAFAKFLAIYPDESHQLQWVLIKIAKIKCSEYLRKYMATQISELLMRRDTSLSPELKKKIQSIAQLIISAKIKIRNAWEAAMNGSTNKLLPMFSKATDLIDQIDLKFANLISYHSNNQYALFLYASYLKDIVADYQKSALFKEMARVAQTGKNSPVDKPYLFGRHYFPNMPHRYNMNVNQLTNLTETQTIPTSQEDFGLKDEDSDLNHDAMNLHTQIKSSIDNISIPSVYYSILCILANMFLILIIPFIAFMLLVPTLTTTISSPAAYLSVVTESRSRSMMTFTALLNYRLTLVTNATIQCYSSQPISSYIGGKCDQKEMLVFFNNMALNALNSIPVLQLSKENDKNLKEAQYILFQKEYQFREYIEYDTYANVERCLYTQLVTLLETSLSIVGGPDASDLNVSVYGRQYSNIINNYLNVINLMEETCNSLKLFLLSQVLALRNTFKIIQIAATIGIPVINILLIILCYRWLAMNQRITYKCFNALPKSTLLLMMQKLEVYSQQAVSLNHLSSQYTQLTQSEEIQHKKEQDDKIIALFHTSPIGFYNQKILLLMFSLILLTILETCLISYSLSVYIFGADQYMKSTPHISTIISTLVDMQQLATTLTMYAHREYHQQVDIGRFNHSFLSVFDSCLQNFHIFYFGNESQNSNPIMMSTQQLFYSLMREPKFPENLTALFNLYDILPYDLMFYYLMEVLKWLYTTTENINYPLESTNEYLTHMWNLIYVQLYSNFFAPLYWNYVEEVNNLIITQFSSYYLINSLLLVSTLAIIINSIYLLLMIKQQLISVLRLLLHAPPNAVVKSRYLLMLLSGTFNIPEKNLSSLDDSSFYKVVDESPNGIIKTDKSGNVLEMNKSAIRLLGEIKTFNVNSFHNFIEINDNKLAVKIVNVHDFIYVMFHNKTQECYFKQMIQKEEDRRDQLMKIIIPEAILNEYKGQPHHSTIAFQAQTVTVLTINIKCANMDRDIFATFLKHLKTLQKRYPAVNYVDIDFSTFIAVSGLLQTQYNDDASANQLIDFAADAVTYCKSFKTDKKDDMVVQAGVVTGGPLTAGVIYLKKIPRFEIFGDVLDYSKSMSKLAANYSIYMTRSTYEYVYGASYDIREVGEISVPNLGNILSYSIQF